MLPLNFKLTACLKLLSHVLQLAREDLIVVVLLYGQMFDDILWLEEALLGSRGVPVALRLFYFVRKRVMRLEVEVGLW
jgi:hypothetical protein